MGQQSSNSHTGQRELLSQFNLQALNRNQKVTFLSHKQTGQHCILREMVFNEAKQFNNAIQQIKQKMKFAHPNITKIITQNEQTENICARIYKIYVLWQYGEINLADQINRRTLQQKPFQLQQIVNLAKSIADSLLFYCSNGLEYSCLTTKNIVRSSQVFKLIDPSMFSQQSNVETVSNSPSINNIYLSPEECRTIQYRQINQKLDQRSVVFTAAIIILQAANLQLQNQCYLQKNISVNWNHIAVSLQKIEKKYGKDLRKILSKMLERNIKDRTNLRELCKKLKEFDRSLDESMSFSIRTSFSLKDNTKKRLSLSISEAMHNTQKIIKTPHQYPHRMIETTCYLQQPDKESRVCRAPPLLQMKTVNTSTNIQISEPIYSFNHELTTKSPFFNNSFDTTTLSPQDYPNTKRTNTLCDDQNNQSTLTIRKYPHSHESKPVQTYCVEQFKAIGKYEGYKVNGKRQGWGKFYFQDGGFYEGYWKENKMHGYGSLYYSSGKLAYQGNFVMDQFQGDGQLYNETYKQSTQPYNYKDLSNIEQYWVNYKGQFKKDAKVGKGIITLSNTQRYEGLFANDQIHGRGVFFTIVDEKIYGVWQLSILQQIIRIQVEK